MENAITDTVDQPGVYYYKIVAASAHSSLILLATPSVYCRLHSEFWTRAGSNYIQVSLPCYTQSPVAILLYDADSGQLLAEENGNCLNGTYSFTYNVVSFKEKGILSYKVVIIDRKQVREYLVNFSK